MTTFIDAADVARLTGFENAAAFLRGRPRLEDDHGFPMPMPTCRRPLRWRRDAVEAWVAAQGCPAAAELPAQLGPNVHLLRRARSA